MFFFINYRSVPQFNSRVKRRSQKQMRQRLVGFVRKLVHSRPTLIIAADSGNRAQVIIEHVGGSELTAVYRQGVRQAVLCSDNSELFELRHLLFMGLFFVAGADRAGVDRGLEVHASGVDISVCVFQVELCCFNGLIEVL